MDKKRILLNQLARVERLAGASKWQRLLANPLSYISAIWHKTVIYPRTKQSKPGLVNTFFGSKMHLLLPASADIYLTGGKTHESEIRLARFLIHNLSEGDCFLDIGAHYGYFSMLAVTLVGQSGKVYAFEAAPATFSILQKNASTSSQLQAFHKAVASEGEPVQFYEFSNLYSEYNAIDIRQFEEEEWFKENQPEPVTVPALSLDNFVEQQNVVPHIIKIDVEGAEYDVIRGADKFLRAHSPILAIEYLAPHRNNKQHRKAVEFLQQLGYHSFIIDKEGKLKGCTQLDAFLEEQSADSDNIIFCKQSSETFST